MKATSRELLKYSCDLLTNIEKGAVSIEQAKAAANVIKQANNIYRYELDRAIAIQKYENIVIRDIEDVENIIKQKNNK